MSNQYTTVLWNKNKKKYDRIILILIILYFVIYAALFILLFPEGTIETLIIRSTGLLAFSMLHVILIIGPLTRISSKFLPLLYNRRHLGVTMFMIALVHGLFNLIQYHALGNVDILSSLIASNTHYFSVTKFPFQVLGFFSLCILFIMAATSHDYWLKVLTPRIWKSLHMLVYFAYFMLIFHVMLGVGQQEESLLIPIFIFIGFSIVVSLHLHTGFTSKSKLIKKQGDIPEFIELCHINEIVDHRAKTFILREENIAVFKYDGQISAVSNICKHQNGPLGEGKIVDGCITCPWHGYQYFPHNGSSPPPFDEKVKTYYVKIKNNMIWLNPVSPGEGINIQSTKINFYDD